MVMREKKMNGKNLIGVSKLSKWCGDHWKKLVLAVFFVAGVRLVWHWMTTECTYYPYGKLQSESEVVPRIFFVPNNRENGRFRAWYENGQLKDEGYVSVARGGYYGTWKWWGPDGKLLDSWTFTPPERPADGTRRSIYDNGKPHTEWTYLNGQYNGPYRVWAPDGFLMDDWFFDHGKPKDGTRIIYDEEHRKVHEYTYKDGVQDGPEIAWQPDGKETMEKIFRGGGLAQERDYDPNGNIHAYITWNPPSPPGQNPMMGTYVLINYFKNGEKSSVAKWVNGKETFLEAFDEKGNVTGKGNW